MKGAPAKLPRIECLRRYYPSAVRIATWNVNGIRAREAQLAEWLRSERPDVVCLQELKAEASQIPEPCKREEYWAYWHCLRGYSGVSLQVRRDLVDREPGFRHPSFDMESRIVQFDLDEVTFASVYVPNGGKDFPAKIGFLEQLIAWSRQIQAEGRQLVLCGDLNIARADMDVHPKERKPRAIGQLPEERALFERLLGDHLVDVARALDPANENLFTWWAPWRNLRARNIGWRLDYILASKPIATRAESCIVQAAVGTSDHAPVIMRVA
jgi:exodeoxyribonuclease-3